jgi:hypothetical protein
MAASPLAWASGRLTNGDTLLIGVILEVSALRAKAEDFRSFDSF